MIVFKYALECHFSNGDVKLYPIRPRMKHKPITWLEAVKEAHKMNVEYIDPIWTKVICTSYGEYEDAILMALKHFELLVNNKD